MTLKEMIEFDIKNVFCKDDTEFSEKILFSTNSENEKFIYASLQSNEVQNNAGNSNVLIQYTHSLNIPYEDIYTYNIKPNQIIYLNHKPYKIISFVIEMGMYIIQLKEG